MKKVSLFLSLIILFTFCSTVEYSREKCIEANQQFYDNYELALKDKKEYEDRLSKLTSSIKFEKFKVFSTIGFEKAFPINNYDSSINNYSSTISVKAFVSKYKDNIEFLAFSPNRHSYYLLEHEENDYRSEHFVKFKDSTKLYSFYAGKDIGAVAELNDEIKFILTDRFIEYLFLSPDNKILMANEEIFYDEFRIEIDEIKLFVNNKNVEGSNLNEIMRNFYKNSYESLSEWKYFFTEHQECLDVPEIKYQLSETVLINDAIDVLYKNTIEEMNSVTYKTLN